MTMARSMLALVLSLAVLNAACADISLTTVDTHDRVISRHKRVVPSSGVRIRSRVSGTTLVLRTTQGCDLVEMEEVERTEVLEADEDLTEELVILGVAIVPLVSGIIILADAPNVYEDDRNERLYNSVGQDGAYVGGTILTSVGGLLAMVPIIELLRLAGAREQRQELLTRQGLTVAGSVPCEGEPAPVQVAVALRLADSDVHTPGTDSSGFLEIDLARTIPHELARRATSVQVLVAGRVVGELDIAPILDAQRELLARERFEPPPERFEPPPVIATGDPEDAIGRAIEDARAQLQADLEAERSELCANACIDVCERIPLPIAGEACFERCQEEVCP